MNISLIGSGNLAFHLAKALHTNGFKILEIIARNEKEGRSLATLTASTFQNNFQKINAETDIIFLTVSDSSIQTIAHEIEIGNKLLVHCSGALALNEIKTANNRSAVFYPLQTFSKEKEIDFSKIPVFLEAEYHSDLEILKTIAEKITNKVFVLDSNKRKEIHLSAVLANNFSNHLWYLSSKILKHSGQNFDILKPLLEETLHKAFELGPFLAQTGPAARNDQKTIENHLKMLENDKNLRNIYQLISASIYDSKKDISEK